MLLDLLDVSKSASASSNIGANNIQARLTVFTSLHLKL